MTGFFISLQLLYTVIYCLSKGGIFIHLFIQRNERAPIYEQIIRQIKEQIADGTLKENDLLPSIRTLAKELQISALTIKKAYDQLEQEQIVSTVHGKGTYINACSPVFKKEKQQVQLEEELLAWISKARQAGLSNAQQIQLLEILLEEKDA